MHADLELVLADMAEDAAVLRRHGQTAMADTLEKFATRVRTGAEPWLRKLTMAEARMKSGASLRWLQRMAREWADADLAGRTERGDWWIRDCAVRQRTHRSAVEEAARLDAQREARESA